MNKSNLQCNWSLSPDLVFWEDPEVTNSREASVWRAAHQQYSTWNCIRNPFFFGSCYNSVRMGQQLFVFIYRERVFYQSQVLIYQQHPNELNVERSNRVIITDSLICWNFLRAFKAWNKRNICLLRYFIQHYNNKSLLTDSFPWFIPLLKLLLFFESEIVSFPSNSGYNVRYLTLGISRNVEKLYPQYRAAGKRTECFYCCWERCPIGRDDKLDED